jgi:hypothetical protein
LRKLENFSKGIDIPVGFVPSTTYWLVKAMVDISVSAFAPVTAARDMARSFYA